MRRNYKPDWIGNGSMRRKFQDRSGERAKRRVGEHGALGMEHTIFRVRLSQFVNMQELYDDFDLMLIRGQT